MNEESVRRYDFRGQNGSDLTVEQSWNIGKALAEWLPTLGGVVVVAMPGKQELESAVIEGLRLQGRTVIQGGSGDGAKVSSVIMSAKLSGGVVVLVDGGKALIELYDSNGKRIEGEALLDIQSLVDSGNFVPADGKGELAQLA